MGVDPFTTFDQDDEAFDLPDELLMGAEGRAAIERLGAAISQMDVLIAQHDRAHAALIATRRDYVETRAALRRLQSR